MSISERIDYDPLKLEPIIENLRTVQGEWENLLAELNGIISVLNSGFIAETQEAFNSVHEAKKASDYALLTQLLVNMPQSIQDSLDGMLEDDRMLAQRIREQYGV